MAACQQLRLPKCLPLLIISFLLDYLAPGACASTSWEHLSLRYGIWYRPPRSSREAHAMGYRRVNPICLTETYHGFLYVHPHNDKSRLIFDLNDRLSGIQTAIPGNMRGYNSLNQSMGVPSKDIIPPILLSKEVDGSGNEIYTITAYFKHPSLICSPLGRQAHPGKGLYIQMGYQVTRQYEKIPLDARRLSTDWKTGSCLPIMGRHYFKWLSPDLPCERLYPVFLMYNGEGQLGGFGWLFQGTPEAESAHSLVKWFKLSPQFYPALFDPAMLPSCMSNPNFRVFGVRIYLRNEDTMTCPQSQDKDDDDNNNNAIGEDNNGVGDNSNNDNDNSFRHHHRTHNRNPDNGASGSNPRHRHKSGSETGGKPVVKIPTNHNSKNSNNNNNNNNHNQNQNNNRNNPGTDKWDYLGPAFNVRGTNTSVNNPHRHDKKSGQGSTGNNKKDIIVADDKYGGRGACVKPFSLLSLLAMAVLAFQICSSLSSSSSPTTPSLFLSSSSLTISKTLPTLLPSSSPSSSSSSFSLSTILSLIVDHVYYLPCLPSYMYYHCFYYLQTLCTTISTVPCIIRLSLPLLVSPSTTPTPSSFSSSSPSTTGHTTSTPTSSTSRGREFNPVPFIFLDTFRRFVPTRIR